MSPLVPPRWLYRGAQPAAACVRRVVVYGTPRGSAAGGVGSTMRQGWAETGQDAHHRLPARPSGFQELGAGRMAQPGNGTGCQGGGEWVPAPGPSPWEGVCRRGAGRAVRREGVILGSLCPGVCDAWGAAEAIGAAGRVACGAGCRQRGTRWVSCLCSVCAPPCAPRPRSLRTPRGTTT